MSSQAAQQLLIAERAGLEIFLQQFVFAFRGGLHQGPAGFLGGFLHLGRDIGSGLPIAQDRLSS